MKKNYQSSKIPNKKKQVNDIVDILFNDHTLEPDEAEEIRYWLAGDEYSRLKNEALQRVFEENFRLSDRSEYAPDMWPALADRLKISHDPYSSHTQTLCGKNERDKKLTFYRSTAFRVAAVLLPFLIMAGIITYKTQGLSGDVLNYETALITHSALDDHSMTVLLPDGSIVEMSSGSTISYKEDFNGSREVLFSGEGYFKVESIGGLPFVVNTNTIMVTVTGTEFQISALDEAGIAEVILTSGEVLVTAKGIDETVMHVKEHFIYNKEHSCSVISEISDVEKMELMGIDLDFNTSLGEILATMGRYLDMKLEVDENIDLGRVLVVPFNGSETPEEVMNILKYMTGEYFDYRIENRTILIRDPYTNP